MDYRPPLDEIVSALETAGLDRVRQTGAFGGLDRETVVQVLQEAGRLMAGKVAPLNTVGDAHPARLEDGAVVMPPGWEEAYRACVEGGWLGLPFAEAIGGMGLPFAVNAAVAEMMNAANLAFGVGPVLTQGAAGAVAAHASEELKAAYLPRLVTGEWSGTMNLTEPQAGTDLALLRTRAEPHADGSYRIAGTKIFITYGEHDLTRNIVHLVLARLPDAPPGTKGISLFLVPKFLPKPDGSPGPRNDVRCVGLEHKLGLHGSPTCVMAYGEAGGATGWLVGEPNQGVSAMFTMMNEARLMVGIQGVGIADRAGQAALAYARQRLQGRRPGIDGPAPIVQHPDVRRNLATIQALTAASRLVCYATAVAIDLARHSADPETRAAHQARADLLTPVAKAFSTDAGVQAASIGLQVHGGMGYIEETGAAQILRDARITPIYEGTNGVQAMDLVSRKLMRDGGAAAKVLIAELKAVASAAMTVDDTAFGQLGYRLNAAVDDLDEATDWLVEIHADAADAALAGATPYLRLLGLTAGGGLLARGALGAAAGPGAKRRILLARLFAENLLPETGALRAAIRGGSEGLLAYEVGDGAG